MILVAVAGLTGHEHDDESPEPMFYFADPDGNGLVYLEEEPGDANGS